VVALVGFNIWLGCSLKKKDSFWNKTITTKAIKEKGCHAERPAALIASLIQLFNSESSNI
jgi:hypothetical protein